jgi:hypothetical protein
MVHARFAKLFGIGLLILTGVVGLARAASAHQKPGSVKVIA